MKKILLGIATLLTVGASAQLTHVKTFTEDYVKEPLSHEYNNNMIEGKSYFIVGEHSSGYHPSVFSILNSDFTVFKTVTIDTSGFGASGYIISDAYFSNHIYNTDDKIELVYCVRSKWDAPIPDLLIRTVVLDEDGNELQVINDIALYMDEPFLVDGKTYCRGRDANENFVIYEAAGTVPCLACSSVGSTANKRAPEKVYDITLYPNPTASTITLAINTDKTNLLVHIYSMDGKLVKTAKVVNGSNLIDTSDLTAGTYIYNVQTDTEVIHVSQFIKK